MPPWGVWGAVALATDEGRSYLTIVIPSGCGLNVLYRKAPFVGYADIFPQGDNVRTPHVHLYHAELDRRLST